MDWIVLQLNLSWVEYKIFSWSRHISCLKCSQAVARMRFLAFIAPRISYLLSLFITSRSAQRPTFPRYGDGPPTSSRVISNFNFAVRNDMSFVTVISLIFADIATADRPVAWALSISIKFAKRSIDARDCDRFMCVTCVAEEKRQARLIWRATRVNRRYIV